MENAAVGVEMLLTQEITERRALPRMPVRHPIAYRPKSDGLDRVAELANLSGSGMLFMADCPHAVGDEMRVRISPPLRITPPLEARIRVVRCERRPGNRFAVAVAITQML